MIGDDAIAEGLGVDLDLTIPEQDTWRTPGASMTEAVAQLSDVVAIYESVDPDRFTVFILLDDDPDETLDAIFDAESSLYDEFPRMPFDVRVTKACGPWAEQPPDAHLIVRYKRPE